MSPLCPISCMLGHRRTSTLQGLHIGVASCQSQGFIPRATSHAFPLTNPRHSLLSWTVLLACLTSKPLFFKHFFRVSRHLFRGLPTERLPVHTPWQSSPHGRSNGTRLHRSFHLDPFSFHIAPLSMYFPSQTPATHSYPGPFSLLA